jgi:hypothetical protein
MFNITQQLDSNGDLVTPASPLPIRQLKWIECPWRPELLLTTQSASAGSSYGPLPEYTSSVTYNDNGWGPFSAAHLYAVANAGSNSGAGTFYGATVEFEFTGSLFGLLQFVQPGTTTYSPAYPFCAVIDGVAYPGDWRTPVVQMPATNAYDAYQKLRVHHLARGLHPGVHTCQLQFPCDAVGGQNRTWAFPAMLLEDNGINLPMPLTEVMQAVNTITLSTNSGSPTATDMRNVSAPKAIGIKQIFLTNQTASAVVIGWRPKFANGVATNQWMYRTIPANDTIVLAPQAGMMWDNNIEMYALASAVVYAVITYQR